MKQVLEEMWAALAAYQPQADEAGHGDSWAKMCREKTSAAAAHAAALGASYGAFAASFAAEAVYAEDAEECAQKAIDSISLIIKPAQHNSITV